jgi:hypothetical protein
MCVNEVGIVTSFVEVVLISSRGITFVVHIVYTIKYVIIFRDGIAQSV